MAAVRHFNLYTRHLTGFGQQTLSGRSLTGWGQSLKKCGQSTLSGKCLSGYGDHSFLDRSVKKCGQKSLSDRSLTRYVENVFSDRSFSKYGQQCHCQFLSDRNVLLQALPYLYKTTSSKTLNDITLCLCHKGQQNNSTPLNRVSNYNLHHSGRSFLAVTSDSVWNKSRHHCLSGKHVLGHTNLPLQGPVSMATYPVRYYSNIKFTQQAPVNVSPLRTKRPKKKLVSEEVEQVVGGDLKTVVAYATAEEYDLVSLRKALAVQGLYETSNYHTDVEDVAVYAHAKYSLEENSNREIYFFSEGSMVFWNVPEIERLEVLKLVANFAVDSYSNRIILHEKETMRFQYTKSNVTNLVGDMFCIQSQADQVVQTYEKYAFSNALAQSVHLNIREAELDQFVVSMEPITEALQRGNYPKISSKSVLSKLGDLFALRSVINLSSELLDTPDFYWEHQELEHLYLKTFKHLNITRRIKVINEKINYCSEIIAMVNNQKNDSHHIRLEWMIIVLIAVEIVFECLHYIERWSESREDAYVGEEDGEEKDALGDDDLTDLSLAECFADPF